MVRISQPQEPVQPPMAARRAEAGLSYLTAQEKDPNAENTIS